MKTVLTSDKLAVPEGVTVEISKRVVTVTGPLGTLKRDFRHVSADMYVKDVNGVKTVFVQIWFATRKVKCSSKSVLTHIKNMLTGVQQGYKFRMRYAYAHFPIQCNIINDNKTIEIKNFIGERIVRTIVAKEGVTITKREEDKDQIWVRGISLENVSQTCSLISQACTVKNKDIRMFLDGIYVSDKRLALNEDL